MLVRVDISPLAEPHKTQRSVAAGAATAAQNTVMKKSGVLTDCWNTVSNQRTASCLINEPENAPRYTFNTKEYLPAAGLYLYQYRAYDPIAGRWTQRDPIDYQDSINLYQFCGNNPVNLTDPDGRVVIVAVAGPLVVVGYAWLIYTKTAKPIDDQSLPNTYEGYTRLGVGRYKCGENPIMNAGGMAHEQQHMRDTFSLFSNAEKEQRAFRAQVSAIDAAIQKLKDEAKAAGRSLTPQEEAHIREAQEHRDFIKNNFLDIKGAQRYDKEVNQRR